MTNNENAKREMTIEELKLQLDEARKICDTLAKTVRQKEQDEKDRREAELALQKETRHREIKTKKEELEKLISAYCKDYGTYSTTRSSSDYPFFWKSLGWF